MVGSIVAMVLNDRIGGWNGMDQYLEIQYKTNF